MKAPILLVSLMWAMTVHSADVFVQGYQRSDGSYVAPHTRSAPDNYKWNNYGTPSSQNIERQEATQFRDLDHDNIYNQYDFDNDNDGIADDFE